MRRAHQHGVSGVSSPSWLLGGHNRPGRVLRPTFDWHPTVFQVLLDILSVARSVTVWVRSSALSSLEYSVRRAAVVSHVGRVMSRALDGPASEIETATPWQSTAVRQAGPAVLDTSIRAPRGWIAIDSSLARIDGLTRGRVCHPISRFRSKTVQIPSPVGFATGDET